MSSPTWCYFCYSYKDVCQLVTCSEEGCKHSMCSSPCQPFSSTLMTRDTDGFIHHTCIHHQQLTSSMVSPVATRSKRKNGLIKSSLPRLHRYTPPQATDPLVSVLRRADIVEYYMDHRFILCRTVIGSHVSKKSYETLRDLWNIDSLDVNRYVSIQHYRDKRRAQLEKLHSHRTTVLYYIGHAVEDPRGLELAKEAGREIIVPLPQYLTQVNASFAILLCCGVWYSRDVEQELKQVCRQKHMTCFIPLNEEVYVADVLAPVTKLARILSLLHRRTLPEWRPLLGILGCLTTIDWWICDRGNVTTLKRHRYT